jgi:hypothetical protein
LRLARQFPAFAVVTVAACAPVPSAPQAIPDSFDEKTWEQQKVLLPAYPKPENLAGIYVGPNTSFQFFVDIASVSVTPDGAVRYILVALSSSGATNVGYEAIRCKTYEHRTYAFGRSDGTWSQSRNPLWIPISGAQANRQHAVLAEEFFCPGHVPPRNAGDAAKTLDRHRFPAR